MAEKIEIGKIVAAFGIAGEVRVYNYSGFRDRFENLDRIVLDDESIEITGVKHHKDQVILALSGITDRDAAEKLRGKTLYMTEADLLELPPDSFYVRDLMGMEVRDGSGTFIGTVKDVLTDRPQDVYVVSREGEADLLIPAVDAFIRNVDKDSRVITVELIEGMM